MTIVERAREYVRNLGGDPQDYLVWQLADEIERLEALLRGADGHRVADNMVLRTKIMSLKAALAEETDALAKAEADNEQLRTALEPFARNVDAVSLSATLGHITREHLQNARRALEPNALETGGATDDGQA